MEGSTPDADALAAGICLLAWIVRHESALAQYHRWLIETGVVAEPDIPSLGEYRQHLRGALDRLVVMYGCETASAA